MRHVPEYFQTFVASQMLSHSAQGNAGNWCVVLPQKVGNLLSYHSGDQNTVGLIRSDTLGYS